MSVEILFKKNDVEIPHEVKVVGDVITVTFDELTITEDDKLTATYTWKANE